jgi:hypothetical protein
MLGWHGIVYTATVFAYDKVLVLADAARSNTCGIEGGQRYIRY